jgi:hypothetical protein
MEQQPKKSSIFLHISKKSSTFAADFVNDYDKA